MCHSGGSPDVVLHLPTACPMKQCRTRLAWIVVAGLTGLAFGFGSARLLESHTARPTTSFMETQRGHLARLDGASLPGRVVFLGSSTFQGLDVSAVTPVGLNLGLGGDTIKGLADRMTDYTSPRHASAVIVNIGLNDLMQRCTLPKNSLATVLTQVPASIPILVLGVQAIDTALHGARCDGRIAELIGDLNKQQAQACASRPACTFVQHPANLQAAPTPASSILENDGIHLSASGYLELIHALRSALADLAPNLAAPATSSP